MPSKNWSLQKKVNTKPALQAEIAASADVPEEAKAFLVARVAECPKDIVRLDAHCHVHGDKEVYSIAISGV